MGVEVWQGELLTEDAALSLVRSFKLLRSDQLPRAKEKLRAYRDNQTAKQEPLWPSVAKLERQREQDLEKIWLDGAPVPGRR